MDGSENNDNQTVYEKGNVRVDTLTVLGHRYLMVVAPIGAPSIVHEASCEKRDMEQVLNFKNVFVFPKKVKHVDPLSVSSSIKDAIKYQSQK
jgi:hypothetical protein